MKKNKKLKTKIMAVSAAAGALYAVLTMILAPVSYGPVQARLSEALCVLPFFIPQTAFGLAAGCLISNLLTGNIFDVIFGSAATLLAGIGTAWAGKRERIRTQENGEVPKKFSKYRILACAFPVIFNALIISAVIVTAYNGLKITENLSLYFLYAFQIGIGEAIVLFALGLPLLGIIPRLKIFSDLV